MNLPFQLTPQAAEDIDAIWWFISRDNQRAADRVENEIIASCRRLAQHPVMGTRRPDITPLPVRFWALPRFSNYLIVYKPNTVPLQVIAILNGRRDLKTLLQERS